MKKLKINLTKIKEIEKTVDRENLYYRTNEYTNTQPAHDIPETFPKDPLKVITPRTYRGLSGDPQGTNAKTDNLMKKLFFKNNSPRMTYLFLLFTGRTNIQKF